MSNYKIGKNIGSLQEKVNRLEREISIIKSLIQNLQNNVIILTKKLEEDNGAESVK